MGLWLIMAGLEQTKLSGRGAARKVAEMLKFPSKGEGKRDGRKGKTRA